MSIELFVGGHGNWLPAYGEFLVPARVKIKFYVPDGEPFDDAFEMALVRKAPLEWYAPLDTIEVDYKEELILPGRTCKNYLVHHPAGLKLSRKEETATKVTLAQPIASIKDKDYLYVEEGKALHLKDMLAKFPPMAEERVIHCYLCRRNDL